MKLYSKITISDVAALPSGGIVKTQKNSNVLLGYAKHLKKKYYLPESEGFWEWRADGTLTIKRWSSTGTSDVSEELNG